MFVCIAFIMILNDTFLMLSFHAYFLTEESFVTQCKLLLFTLLPKHIFVTQTYLHHLPLIVT